MEVQYINIAINKDIKRSSNRTEFSHNIILDNVLQIKEKLVYSLCDFYSLHNIAIKINLLQPSAVGTTYLPTNKIIAIDNHCQQFFNCHKFQTKKKTKKREFRKNRKFGIWRHKIIIKFLEMFSY